MIELSDDNGPEKQLSAEKTIGTSVGKKFFMFLYYSIFLIFLLVQLNTVSTVASPSQPCSSSYLFNDETIDSFIFAIAIESILFTVFVSLFFLEIPKMLTRTWYRLALSSLFVLMVIVTCKFARFNLFLNSIYISIAIKITLLLFELSKMEQIAQRDLLSKISLISLVITITMVVIGSARWLNVIPGIPGFEVLGLGIESKSLTFGDFFDFFILNASFDTITIIVFVITAIMASFSFNNARIKSYTSFHYLKLRSKPTGWYYLTLFYCVMLVIGVLLIGFQMITNSTYLLFFTICCCGITAMISSEDYINSGKHPIYSFLTAMSTTLVLISLSIYFSGKDLGIISIIGLSLPYIVIKFIFLQKEEKPLIRNY
ncbi:MAG: hypothetical protein ACTSP4_02815 [Candidatus Hodarchaeales archaeon]